MPHNVIMLKYFPFLRKKKMLKVFSITASHKMGLYFIVWIETRVFECVRFSLNSKSVKFNLESPLRFLMGIISIITWSVWDEGTVCSQENIQIFEEVWPPSSVIFFLKV